jgi:hypothetical protein
VVTGPLLRCLPLYDADAAALVENLALEFLGRL